MNWYLFVLLPLSSAFIGWFAIWLLIRMLFRPFDPVNVLGITFQGIFSRRQTQIAHKLGALASDKMFSFAEIEARITNEENIKKIMPVVEVHVDEFLNKRLGEAFPMIGMLIGERTIGTLKGIFMKELETIFPIILKGYVQNLQADLDLENLVAAKIAAIPPQQVEAAFYQSAGKELRKARFFFACIGLVVGVVQAVVVGMVM